MTLTRGNHVPIRPGPLLDSYRLRRIGTGADVREVNWLSDQP